MLWADKRDLSNGKEETSSDDQLPANDTDVQSDFFTKNRFSPIACEEEEEAHELNETDPAPPKQADSDNNSDNNCEACNFRIRQNLPCTLYKCFGRCLKNPCKHCLAPVDNNCEYCNDRVRNNLPINGCGIRCLEIPCEHCLALEKVKSTDS